MLGICTGPGPPLSLKVGSLPSFSLKSFSSFTSFFWLLMNSLR